MLLVSFRVRMYSHIANEKSRQMVMGRRNEHGQRGLQRELNEDRQGGW